MRPRYSRPSLTLSRACPAVCGAFLCTRCKLPVEMWFAMDDMPDQGAWLTQPFFQVCL